MSTIETKNAIITHASLEIEDRCGQLSVNLRLDYGGSCQGFGGYALGGRDCLTYKANVAGHFIRRCMEVADVRSWNEMKGCTIRVRAEFGKVHAIGHIIKDNWFNPELDFEPLRTR